MPVTKAQKSEILKKIDEKFGKAKAVYFSQNKGLPVKKISELRKKLYKEGIDLMVAKKTLLRLSAKNHNLPEIPNELMEGAISAAFSYGDVVSPARVLYQFSKENENLQLLGGVVEGRILTKAEAKELAMLPSREVLLAKLVGTMKAPISGLHAVLSGVIRKFVYGMKAVHDKKAANAPAPAAAMAPVPTETPATPAETIPPAEATAAPAADASTTPSADGTDANQS